jgi:hypothetical protein
MADNFFPIVSLSLSSSNLQPKNGLNIHPWVCYNKILEEEEDFLQPTLIPTFTPQTQSSDRVGLSFVLSQFFKSMQFWWKGGVSLQNAVFYQSSLGVNMMMPL